MKIEPTAIRDVCTITPVVHGDNRGFFMETLREDELAAAGIRGPWVQHNHSRSEKRNTLRGLNFQFDPPVGKIMRVTRGAAFLVAVDIRKGSPTLGKWFGLEASEENKIQLYAPAGFARGFQTLVDGTEVQYATTDYHRGEGEGEIAWNDADIGIDWPIKEEPILSERNRNAGSFAAWLARPESDAFRF